jgi:hypothetical protein
MIMATMEAKILKTVRIYCKILMKQLSIQFKMTQAFLITIKRLKVKLIKQKVVLIQLKLKYLRIHLSYWRQLKSQRMPTIPQRKVRKELTISMLNSTWEAMRKESKLEFQWMECTGGPTMKH